MSTFMLVFVQKGFIFFILKVVQQVQDLNSMTYIRENSDLVQVVQESSINIEQNELNRNIPHYSSNNEDEFTGQSEQILRNISRQKSTLQLNQRNHDTSQSFSELQFEATGQQTPSFKFEGSSNEYKIEVKQQYQHDGVQQEILECISPKKSQAETQHPISYAGDDSTFNNGHTELYISSCTPGQTELQVSSDHQKTLQY